MAKVALTRRAHDDLARLRQWLAERNPNAAERAAQAILDRFANLSEFPLMGVAVEDSGARELAIDFGRDGFVAL